MQKNTQESDCQLTIRFLGSYREIVGWGERTITISKPAIRLSQLLVHLRQVLPEGAKVFASRDKLIAVNHEVITRECTIEAGDEVAFLPPITGG